MKISNDKISDCRVKLTVSAGPDETRADYDKVVATYKRNARIPGFRPGKAPLNVIEKFYGQRLNADIKGTLIERFCREAIEQEKLDIVAQVNVEDVVFTPEEGITFTTTYDIKPQIKLPKYQKIPVKFNEITVDDAEIEQRIENLRKQMSPREDVDDAIVAEDMVQISFEAKSGRKLLSEVVPDAGNFAKAEDFWAFASDEAPFIPGLPAALIGKKKGEEFELETKFPKDFSNEALRGVKAKYTGTVKAVRRAKLIDDAELAKNVNMESIDKIRDTLRQHMLDEANAVENKRIRDEISEYLLKKSSFEVPESMILAYEEGKLEEIIRNLGQQKDVSEYAREHAEELKKQAHESAENTVRLNYVLEGIAAEQKIELTEAEINQEIDSAARYFAMRGDKNMTADKLRENLYRSGRIVLIKMDLLASKTIKWIADDLKAAKEAK